VSGGWVDAGWTIAAGAATVIVLVAVLAATERIRRPVVRDPQGRWRAPDRPTNGWGPRQP
jgi:hypothetical protein